MEEKYKRIGEEIIGKNIIWYPEKGTAEILLVLNEPFPYDENVKMIQTISAGVDHLNLERIKKETIVCSNAGAYAISVAEHSFSLILCAMKKIIERNAEMKAGIFNPQPTRLLYKKTIGIVGYGGIGRRVARIAKALDMNVIAITRDKGDENSDEIYELKDLGNVVEKSDIVLISIPLTKYTENIFNYEILKRIKRDGIIVNVARAEIVVKEDLLRILNERKDIMYLSDVWWDEPDVKDTNIENAILTPHIAGGKSGEIMEIAFREAFLNIKRFIDGEKPKNIVKREEYKKIERKNVGV